MKKRMLVAANVALGAMSMLFAGCHTQKQVQPAEPDQPVIEQPEAPQQPVAQEPEPVVCKYGVPPEVYERPMRKYGVPDAREQKKKK
jgi:hypothetical protein